MVNWYPLVQSISIVVLAIITGYYAKKVSEQTEIMEKGRKRPQIVEQVKYALSPFINVLSHNINFLEIKQFGFSPEKKIFNISRN